MAFAQVATVAILPQSAPDGTNASHLNGCTCLAAYARTSRGMPVSAPADALVGRMSSLPPHPEVPGAPAVLARTRLRMVALTNSVQHVAEEQPASAGLSGYFEAVTSANSTGHLKLAPQPYRAAAERCGVSTGEVRLVAAHSWDIAGALAARCQAAFVSLPPAWCSARSAAGPASPGRTWPR